MTSVALGRVLGVVGFGQYGILNSTTGTLGPLSAMQVGLTSTKHVAEYRDTEPVRAARVMTMTSRVAAISGGLTALVLAAASPFIAKHWLAAPGLTGPLAISAVLLLFNSLASSQAGALAGFEAFRELAWINTVVSLLNLPLLVGGALLYGVAGVAAAWSIGQFINWRVNHAVLMRICRKHGLPVKVRPEREDYAILWKFSIPSLLASSISGPAFWAASAILVNQSNGYKDMGLFAAANQWRTPVLFITGAMSNAIVPVLASINRTDGLKDFRNLLRFNAALNGVVAVGGGLLVSLMAPLILALYGREFHAGTQTFVVLQLSAVFTALGWVYGSALVTQGRMGLVLLSHVVSAIVLIIGGLALVPKYHALGLAWTITFQTFAFLVLSYLPTVVLRNTAACVSCGADSPQQG